MNIIKKSTELTKSPIFAILSCLLCILAGYSIKSSLIEIFASVMGIINVWLLSKEKISNFIFGIITVLAYLYIYYTTEAYTHWRFWPAFRSSSISMDGITGERGMTATAQKHPA